MVLIWCYVCWNQVLMLVDALSRPYYGRSCCCTTDVDQNESALTLLSHSVLLLLVLPLLVMWPGASFYKESNSVLVLILLVVLHVLDTGNVHAIFQRNGGSSKLAIKNNTTTMVTLHQVNGPNSIRFEATVKHWFPFWRKQVVPTQPGYSSTGIDLKKNTATAGTERLVVLLIYLPVKSTVMKCTMTLFATWS